VRELVVVATYTKDFLFKVLLVFEEYFVQCLLMQFSMYIFKSVYSLYKPMVFHALKAEPGEVKCIFYFRPTPHRTSISSIMIVP
jgi:hypothetical protein